MSDAILLLDNQVDTGVIAASSEKSSAPAENLRTFLRSEFWRSAFGDTSNVDVTLLTVGPVNYVAIIDCNLTEEGEIHVEAWDDALGGAVQTVDITLPPSLYVDPTLPTTFFGDGLFGSGPFSGVLDYAAVNARNVTLIPLPATVTSRYWRITFSDPNTSFQTCARIYISLAVQYTLNLSYGWDATHEERSAFRESLGGQIYSQPRDSRLKINAAFNWLTEAERASTLIFLRRFGKRRPILFSIFPEQTVQGLTTTLYGRFSDFKVTHQSYITTSFPFSITEEL